MAYVQVITTALTIDTSAYGAGDVVGGLLTFAVNKSMGRITAVQVIDDDNEKAILTLHLFDQVPTTTIADQAAFAPVIADLKKRIRQVAFVANDYTTVNNNAYAEMTGLSIDYATVTGALYGYLVATATPTYAAATDLTLRITITA